MGGGTSGGHGGRRGGIVGINVTPMVDIMLVLLVIMMVAALQIATRALKVGAPEERIVRRVVAGPPTATLTKDNHVFINNELMADDAALIARFQKAHADNPDGSLVVSADTAALHGHVVHVIDLAKQQESTSKFAINVTE